MNPLQYINKIFCTLLFFSVGNKSYSQREIHPLEPMFTYDYALKYYGNKTLITFRGTYHNWLLENFKAPENVISIEEYQWYSRYSFSHGHYLNRANFNFDEEIVNSLKRPIEMKRIDTYDLSTGFVKETKIFYVDRNSKAIIDTLEMRTYSYNEDNSQTIIDVSIDESWDKPYSFKMQYHFQKSTDNLVKVITRHSDTISFQYGDKENTLKFVEKSDFKRFRLRTLPSSIYYPHNDIKEFIRQEDLILTHPSTYYLDISDTERDNKNHIITNDLKSKQNSIYSYHTNEVNNFKETLSLLNFDNDGRLKAFYEINKTKMKRISEFYLINQPDLSDRMESLMFLGFNSVSLKRKGKNKWDLYAAYKTSEDQYEYKTLKQGTFKIKRGNIYYKNEPQIIFHKQ